MKIHEFQAKQILRDAGVPVLRGIVVRDRRMTAKAFPELGGASPSSRRRSTRVDAAREPCSTSSEQRGVQLVRSAEEAPRWRADCSATTW